MKSCNRNKGQNLIIINELRTQIQKKPVNDACVYITCYITYFSYAKLRFPDGSRRLIFYGKRSYEMIKGNTRGTEYNEIFLRLCTT